MSSNTAKSTFQSTITLFQHGFLGNAAEFKKMVGDLDLYSTTKEILAELSPRELTISTSPKIVKISGDDRIKSWMENFKNLYQPQNVNYFIRTEFKDGVSSVEEQSNELYSYMEKIREATGFDGKFNLVGHSKGGLVNMRTVVLHKNDVNKLISINTPYSANKFAELVSEILDIASNLNIKLPSSAEGIKNLGSEDYLSNLRRDFNQLNKSSDLFVIGSKIAELKRTTILTIDGIFDWKWNSVRKIETDGIVDVSDQLGIGKNNIDNLNVLAPNQRVFTEADLLKSNSVGIIKNNVLINFINNLTDVIPSNIDNNIVDLYFHSHFINIYDLIFGIEALNSLDSDFSHSKTLTNNLTIKQVESFLGQIKII